MKALIFAVSLAASPALSDCPAPVDYSVELEALFAEARAADNDMEGQEVSGKMWQVWLRAPDEAAQAALDSGMRRREVADYTGALAAFDRLTDYCPLYAEGFNQRAFIHFLTGSFERALIDLDAALKLMPDHVAARSGKALTLMNLGRTEEARLELLLALENNPWLSERFLMLEGGPLAVPGEKI